MKHYYRLIDAGIQLVLLATWLVTFIIQVDWWGYFYFIVGGWFAISLFIHLFLSGIEYQKVYAPLAVVTLIIIAIVIIGFFMCPFFFMLLMPFFIIGPLMAAIYTFNCVHEIRFLRKRPLSYLK